MKAVKKKSKFKLVEIKKMKSLHLLKP